MLTYMFRLYSFDAITLKYHDNHKKSVTDTFLPHSKNDVEVNNCCDYSPQIAIPAI